MFRFAALAVAVAAGFSFGATPAKADLITNGGFETGDFAGWNIIASFTSVHATGFSGLSAHSGMYFAALGDASATFGTLDQTVSDTPGDVVALSYWLAGDGLQPNQFEAFWNGASIAGSALSNTGAFPYTQFHFALNATGLDTLVFLEHNPQGYFALDDVSLLPGQPGDIDPPPVDGDPTGVPEPSSMLLIASGLAFVQLMRRKTTKI